MQAASGSYTAANLATVGSRFIALVLDGLLLGLISSALFQAGREPGGVAGVILGVAYQWYFLTQHQGQTPGKMLLGIRVVKADGGKLTGADAIVRYVGYIINSAALLIGWLWALFDQNRQGWHDKIANTLVVKA